MFDVRPMDANSVRYHRKYLAYILEPMFQEMFQAIIHYVERQVPLGSLESGVVLTGGLASTDGLMGTAAQTFGERRLLVRPGVPGGVSGLADMVCEPRFATTVGLLIEASVSDRDRSFFTRDDNRITETISTKIRTFFERMF
jgi:cell division protein FtsA